MNQAVPSDHLMEQAATAYDARQWEEVIQSCRLLLERDPANVAALRLQSRALIDLGQVAAAVSSYETALISEPQNANLWFDKYRLLLSTGNPSAALEALERAVALDPGNLEYMAQRVHALRRAGRDEQALAACEEMVRSSTPQDNRWLGQKADILRGMKRYDSAFETLAASADTFAAADWTRWADSLRFAGNFNEALRYYRKAIDLDARYAAAWRGMGISLSTLDRFEEALDAFTRAAEADPYDALCWVDKGNLYFDQKNFDEARACYETALTIEPSNQYALTNIGLIHERFSQWAEAIPFQKRALQADPNFLPAVLSLAGDLFASEQFADALDAYTHALKLQPDSFSALINKGSILFWQKKFGEAIEYYEKAMESPEREADRSPWIYKAKALRELRRYGECEACLREALQGAEVGDQVQALNDLGVLLLDILQREDEAHQCFLKMHELSKGAPEAKANLAESSLRAGRYAEARDYAEAAISAYKQSPIVTVFKFLVFATLLLERKLEDIPAAFTELTRSLQTQPIASLKDSWDFSNFTWIASEMSTNPLVRFILMTLVDVQTGKLPLDNLTFFEVSKTDLAAASSAVAV